MDVCLAYGFETMSHVETWKGNEFIALASDVSWDYPVGGFYSGYYAMMVTRHMKEFGTTVEQMAHVSVKNHLNAYHNPYAQKRERLTVEDVRQAPMVAWPLTRLDICVMSDGAAATILASEEGLKRLEAAGGRIPRPLVRVTGIGRGTDAMRMADRPHVDYETFLRDYATEQEKCLRRDPRATTRSSGTTAPATRACTPSAPDARPATWPTSTPASPIRCTSLDFVELHDAYTSSEIQTYEDMGLCRYGEGGPFAASGKAFMPGIDYGLKLPEKPVCPVNPSGGLIACGHPVGATGLMQAVFAAVAAPGHHRQALRRQGAAGQGRPPRRHPLARRHRHLRHRQHPGKGGIGHGEAARATTRNPGRVHRPRHPLPGRDRSRCARLPQAHGPAPDRAGIPDHLPALLRPGQPVVRRRLQPALADDPGPELRLHLWHARAATICSRAERPAGSTSPTARPGCTRSPSATSARRSSCRRRPSSWP